ncbi:thiol:disulfide interchange protein DsbD [Flavobacterium noncentrifugens]|uniref:Thiol:disulfide interchange protein DsbD n=1 Tax=Flavobacterium noncentrifugens TaxID=1128970 RepID=A0A1G8W5N4_9FLAO|nr:cytochrome c biogenesis protein CcdA [Flavobacterium noncentrifugens]GEP50765.1 thiol:disulfide interchange protein DsbD [Flavobacterium noncentrifugens]SDJ73045.1 thiol:disulfide interchange protein DsbD [Flavobacterium noncentrifugens]
MKKIYFLLLAFFGLLQMNAQILNPVKWSTRTEKISATEFNLVFEGIIEDEWHVYSQFTPDGGPLPMEIKFKNAKGNFDLIGKATETGTKKEFNDVFGVDELFFAKKLLIKQKVKITNQNGFKIDANVDYQVCKSSCINDKKNFTFDIPKITAAAIIPAAPEKNTVLKDTISIVPDTAAAQKATATEKKSVVSETKIPPKQPEQQKGLLSIFIIAFLSGFAALLTPCVFPLIPMTVSFFTKQSKNKREGKKNAIIYGISIIVIYVALGFFVSWAFGADALNSLATNVYFNIIFFILLVIFAASFLGAFEIMLPNSWANKVDKQADRGGIFGILFMALALAIVSFSCTGPIVGTLLFEAASKGVVGPIVGMFGFSLALALPFMLFAMFPGWLNSLPKSGGWLNTVKVFLGFLELALAFKFLSNADLVLQMHLLEREVFLAIWIAIFGVLALYLFGKITMPHDSPLPFISVGRLFLGLLVLSFTVYLIPGLWGAPLKVISAFPPPIEYSENPRGIGKTNQAIGVLPEGAEYGPHDIVTFHDYDKGMAYAKSVNKPVMLDFTGHACVNCRKMEINVWSDKSILPILNTQIVLISLYVDEDIDLPLKDQFVSKLTGEKIITVGDKWTDLMLSKYKTNTQPLYVLTDLDGNSLSETVSYVGVEEYLNWLKRGISKFKK